MKPHHETGWNYTNYGGVLRKRTEYNVRNCIVLENAQSSRLLYDEVSVSICPLPCKEVSFETTITTDYLYNVTKEGDSAKFSLKYRSNRVTHITEIPAYTSDNFFSDVGSWLGLLVGMSFLSLVEIVTFILTFVIELCS